MCHFTIMEDRGTKKQMCNLVKYSLQFPLHLSKTMHSFADSVRSG